MTQKEARLRFIELLQREAEMSAELFHAYELNEKFPSAVGSALVRARKKMLADYRREIWPEVIKIAQIIQGERIPDEFFTWLKNPNEPISS